MWNKFKKIKNRLTWSLGGNVIYAISQWFIVTIIARFGTETDLGLYSLGLAITAPIVLFFNFKLRDLLVTDSENEYKFPQYFGSRIKHLTFSYIVIIVVALIYSKDIVTLLIILLMGLVKFVEALSDICLGFFQKNSRIDLIGKSQFYRGILTGLIVGILYIVTQNIIISVLGLLLVMIIRLITYDMRHLKSFTSIKPVFDGSALQLMQLAYPLGITSLISSFNANIPRYFLDYFSGVEAVGIYSALVYIIVASNLLITPITQLMGPRIANSYHKKGNKPFLKINIQLIIVSLIVFIFIFIPVLLQGELILTILYGAKYAEYSNILIIIVSTLLFAFINGFFSISIVAARFVQSQSIILVISLIITIISGYFLIGKYGLEGAAFSLLISRFSSTVLMSGLIMYILHKKA